MPNARTLFWVRCCLCAAAATPALWLCAAGVLGWLGIDPLKTLMQVSGLSAMTLLMLTLTVTPLRRLSVAVARFAAVRFGRRLSDWNWLIKLRRTLGLFTFFYATLHLALYLILDARLDWAAIVEDVQEKTYLVLGWLAWAALLPLAATSNQASVRRLGRRWRTLHRLVYPIGALVVAHYFMLAKIGDSWPWIFACVFAALMAARLAGLWRGDQGEVAPERPAAKG